MSRTHRVSSFHNLLLPNYMAMAFLSYGFEILQGILFITSLSCPFITTRKSLSERNFVLLGFAARYRNSIPFVAQSGLRPFPLSHQARTNLREEEKLFKTISHISCYFIHCIENCITPRANTFLDFSSVTSLSRSL